MASRLRRTKLDGNGVRFPTLINLGIRIRERLGIRRKANNLREMLCNLRESKYLVRFSQGFFIRYDWVFSFEPFISFTYFEGF